MSTLNDSVPGKHLVNRDPKEYRIALFISKMIGNLSWKQNLAQHSLK